MNIRQMMEKQERENLQEYASFSDEAKRDVYEEPCKIRTAYQRDRDRILHTKTFRRMKDKTQVFLAAAGDHYRNRLTHTLEVTQAARTIAKALRLNEELTEAIGLGHDLGHTPFGHTGEAYIDRALKSIDPHLEFKHYLHSVRVVECLENNGKGLNLTKEVRDGIKNHGTAGRPVTLEGQIVRLCDKIAYINHDIDDAIRADILKEKDLPLDYTKILGHTVRERLNTLISDTIYNSIGKSAICQSDEVAGAMTGLRQFMFDEVYHDKVVKQEEEKAGNMLTELYFKYYKEPNLMPQEYMEFINKGESLEQVVCDYIAGMTDHYAIAKYEELFVPKGWRNY